MERIRLALLDEHPLSLLGLQIILSQVRDIDIVFTATNAKDFHQFLHFSTVNVCVIGAQPSSDVSRYVLDKLTHKHAEMKTIFFVQEMHKEEESYAIKWGLNGYLSKKSPCQEIISSVEHIIKGGNMFPHYASLQAEAVANEESVIQKQLSARESLIANYLAKGKGNKDIAKLLSISSKTVSSHKKNIMNKLNVSSVIQLAHHYYINNISS